MPDPAIIGSATMEADRTIVLNLYTGSDGGPRGMAQARYPLSHPQYSEILAHIGGLEPGGTKAVPAWPDQ
jgi:hypothetical protein